MKRLRGKQIVVTAAAAVACVAANVALLWSLNAHWTNVGHLEKPPKKIELKLQRRDRSSRLVESIECVNVDKMAVVVVDMWTSHYCSGATAEFLALIPRINQTLDAARSLGIQVIFAPSGDDLKRWEGKPQRLRILDLPDHPLPPPNGFMKGAQEAGLFAAPCMCKVTQLKAGTDEPLFQCKGMKSDHNQNPRLIVRNQDLFVAAGHYRPGIRSALTSWGEPAQQELWNFAQTKGITTLVYVGVATNMCVINREFGMIEMRRLGLKTILVRDLTAAMTYNGYNPITKKLDAAWSPAVGTQHAIRYVEENIGPSITSNELIEAISIPSAK